MDQYFASKESTKVAEVLTSKANDWYNELYTNGYLLKLQDCWAAYHGAYFTSVQGGHRITFGGEQGELANLPVNHLRNIGEHMHAIITSNRPAFQARATNTDYKSLAQTKLANELLDYYMREKRLEVYLSDAVRSAIVTGSGYIKLSWNSTTGEIYDYTEEGAPIYEGDVEFYSLSPFDVYYDNVRSGMKDWVVVRSFKNKYDLAAKYPEFEGKIKNLPSIKTLQRFTSGSMSASDDDDIPVYEFFHRKTESMEQGRYLLYLSTDVVLMDTPMPYRSIPVFKVSPSDILGTNFGYSPLFDLMPIQEAINSLYSTILTNQQAFGVQNVYVPRGADVSIRSLEGGLNIIEGNAAAGKPESMNLTNTPGEVFKFLQMLEQTMETVSGINSVVRGNPEASLKSGTALALVQSTALQFMSTLQQNYIRLIEDVGTATINMLKDFAAVPRVAVIAGKSNRAYVEHEFTGDDLSQINRVMIEVGNPLARTTSGKVQIAESLIQYGVIKSPEQYLTVLNTGRLDSLTDDGQNELLLIKSENEKLSDGIAVKALAVDQHIQHIKQHRSVLSDPDLRNDEALTAVVLNHIQDHIDLLKNTDPALLSMIGEQSLQQANPPQSPMPPMDVQQMQAGQIPQGPMGDVPMASSAPNGANMPTPPPPFEGAPVTPEQLAAQNSGG